MTGSYIKGLQSQGVCSLLHPPLRIQTPDPSSLCWRTNEWQAPTPQRAQRGQQFPISGQNKEPLTDSPKGRRRHMSPRYTPLPLQSHTTQGWLSQGAAGRWVPGCLWRGGSWEWAGHTHVDEVVPVADEQVAQDACLVEVSQADHVLHAVD